VVGVDLHADVLLRAVAGVAALRGERQGEQEEKGEEAHGSRNRGLVGRRQ
jgi:hypothetical protein